MGIELAAKVLFHSVSSVRKNYWLKMPSLRPTSSSSRWAVRSRLLNASVRCFRLLRPRMHTACCFSHVRVVLTVSPVSLHPGHRICPDTDRKNPCTAATCAWTQPTHTPSTDSDSDSDELSRSRSHQRFDQRSHSRFLERNSDRDDGFLQDAHYGFRSSIYSRCCRRCGHAHTHCRALGGGSAHAGKR